MRYILAALLIAVLAGSYCVLSSGCSLLTADQQGYRFYKKQDYTKAAERFADSMWKGTALYEAGKFKEAAGMFAGFDSAAGAYNQANSLVMQGKYEEAVVRYERALELRLGWKEAEINKDIASHRAEMMKKEGGNITDGQMGVDEITFDKGKSSPDAAQEETDGGQQLGDAEMRQVWLRKVQTRPADFLKSKFAYQHQFSGETQGEAGTK